MSDYTRPPAKTADATWLSRGVYERPQAVHADATWLPDDTVIIEGELLATVPPVAPTATLAAQVEYIQAVEMLGTVPLGTAIPTMTFASETEQIVDLPDADGRRVGEWSQHLPGKVAAQHGTGWHEALRVATPFDQPHQHGNRLANRCTYPSTEMLRIRRASENRHQHGLKMYRGMMPNANEAHRIRFPTRTDHQHGIPLRSGTGFGWADTIRTYNRTRHEHAEAVFRADPLQAATQEAIRTHTPLQKAWTQMIWPEPGRWWPFYTPPGLTGLVVACRQDYEPRPLNCTVVLACGFPATLPHCPGTDPEPPIDGPIIITAGRVLLMVHDLQIYRTSDGAVIDADNIQLEIDTESWAWGFSAQLLSAEAYDRVQPTVSGPVDLTIEIDGQAFRCQFSGWTLEWAPPDWFVPGGVWTYPSHTPIAAIIDVAQSIGAFVAPDPATDTIRIISRFPEAPWNWGTSIPDYVIQANPIKGITQRWSERPEYNKAWALGQEQGVIVSSTRSGTAGDYSAPQAIHPLITHVDAGRERGRVELSKGGKRLEVTLTMPYMGGAHGPGLIVPGKLLEVEDPAGTWRGLVQGTKILATQTSVEQILTIDRRL